MSYGIELVCPACGTTADLSAGWKPDDSGRLVCADCGGEIPIPVAVPDDSLSDESTRLGDRPTVVDVQHQVHPAEDEAVESDLRDCGSERYEQQSTIGKGGMGEIVICVEHNTRREVAMKRMLPTGAAHAKQRARFVEEAQVTAQLEHPNIVPVHELGRDADGAIYFTMKLVKGRSLSEILIDARDSAESHSLVELLQIFLKACDGVAFAHSRGVVHRDLKPANIMVGDFGEVLVMDWGIARIVGHDETADEETIQTDRQDTDLPGMHTMAGQIMGSPSYMPPEQASGEIDKIDHRSDIYSLGAILYTILTLKSPVEGETAKAMIDTVIAGDIQPPEQRAPGRDIPRELSAVVMKCLGRFRGRRYASVPELQRDVRLYLGGRSVSAAPDTFRQALVKLIKRNKAVSVSIAAAAMVLIVLGAVFVIRVRSERDAALAAQRDRRTTALTASEELGRQAVSAADEGRFSVADERADAAVEIMPDGPWGHYTLGVVAFEKKDLAGARSHMEKALSLDPFHEPSRVFLDNVLAATDQLARLEKLVAGAEESTDWRSLVFAGDTLMAAGRHPQACKVYNRAEELIASQPAVPDNVRLDLKDSLARANGSVKMKGFYESVSHLPVDKQAERLEAELKEIYGPWLQIEVTIENHSLSGLYIAANEGQVPWLDPLRGLPLVELDCSGTNVADLAPLKGMPLKSLDISKTKVTDLAPLKGMALTSLHCRGIEVADLSVLAGMPLEKLSIPGATITDMDLLEGMSLTELDVRDCRVLQGDLSVLAGMKLTGLKLAGCSSLTSLKGVEGMGLTELSLKDCQSLQGDLSALAGMKLTRLVLAGCSSLTSLKGVERMPLTELTLSDCSSLQGDLSALEGMKLISLDVRNCSSLTSLKGIEGMPLTSLELQECTSLQGDLAVLKGMKLTELNLGFSFGLTGLEGVEGMPLTRLDLTNHGSLLGDLSALKGMKLVELILNNCSGLTSLKGLEGMPLTKLQCADTSFSDLRRLKGMQLTLLHIQRTKVADLSPLGRMELETICFTPKSITKGIEIVRGMTSVQQIGIRVDDLMPPEEFWKKYDDGEFD
jgi:Leucine-rich repeat (LRR) protein/tetratricopeptide (TPR) repeat protein